MKNQLNKILFYINKRYEEQGIIRPNILNYPYTIYIQTEKYDLEIRLEIPKEDHYLYCKAKYILNFDFNANKKYRNELDWHGGGHSEEYKENDFSIIDNFLNNYCTKKENKQMSIFD